MKKIFMVFSILLLAFLFAACGDDDDITETPGSDKEDAAVGDKATDDDAGTPEEADDGTAEGTETNNGASLVTDSNYPFTSFDLEVDIEQDDDAVEVEYDIDEDETEISYKHEPKGIKLSGSEALNELDPIFSSFTFDKDTPKEDVINEVLEAFEIPENAVDVELEIEYNDGTEIEYDR